MSAPAVPLMEERSTPILDVIVVAGAVILSAGFGWMAAQLGLKGLVAGFAALLAGTALILVRQKTLLVQAGMVLSMVLLLHKAVGPVATTVASGAPAVYITTLDVVLGLLYLMWYLEGTMWRDIVQSLRRPIFWVPLVGAVLTMFSILAAPSVHLAAAEIFRMGWMYLLFLYLGTRVRSRREVSVILGSFGLVALIELVVVVLQWKTGGVLGLEFLGVPTELGERALDAGRINRPFGTIIHPVFMGAFLGSLGLMALSLAIFLRRAMWRWLALLMVPVCVLPLVLAHTRAAALAFAAGALLLGLIGLGRRRISPKTVSLTLVVGLLGLAVFWPKVIGLFDTNFGQDRVDLELDSRIELNRLALDMFYDSPLVGHGLNNFSVIQESYERYALIFAGNPVHNLFLLQLAETGVIGLAGLLLVGAALAWVAMRLVRSRDPLFAAVGAGALAVYLFYLLEEQLGFSLRQDIPLATFWILAGLTVACLRMDGLLRFRRQTHRPMPPPESPAQRPPAPVRPVSTRAKARHAQPWWRMRAPRSMMSVFWLVTLMAGSYAGLGTIRTTLAAQAPSAVCPPTTLATLFPHPVAALEEEAEEELHAEETETLLESTTTTAPDRATTSTTMSTTTTEPARAPAPSSTVPAPGSTTTTTAAPATSTTATTVTSTTTVPETTTTTTVPSTTTTPPSDGGSWGNPYLAAQTDAGTPADTGGAAEPAEPPPPIDCRPFVYSMLFPVVGHDALISPFGADRPGDRKHEGVDIGAPKLTPVVAVADGVVVRAPTFGEDRCCNVGIRHDDGWSSWYIHLNNDTYGSDDGRGWGVAPSVAEGTRVRAGTVLGWLGDSGNAEETVPHLHFELRMPDRTAIDARASLLAAGRVGPSDFAGPFVDDEVSPFSEAAAALASVGLAQACDDQGLAFCPDRPASGAESLGTLELTFDAELDPEQVLALEQSKGVLELTSSVVDLRGCGERAFCPEEPVTRGELELFIRAAMVGAGPVSPWQALEPVRGEDFDPTAVWQAAALETAALGSGLDQCALTEGLQPAQEDTETTRGELALIIVRMLGLLPCDGLEVVEVPAGPDPATDGLEIVFAAIPRSGGPQAIYRADSDGNIVRISPDDGRNYDWPMWALNGQKIIYTARSGPMGSPEQIYLANPDGSGEQALTSNPWRNGQPRMSPDGRWVLFNSLWDEFGEVALYRLDLATLEVTNLSAVHHTFGAFDSDAKFSEDGSKIVFANSATLDRGTIPTQVYLMNADGTARRPLTDDSFFNTDPELSPEGSRAVFASYRGEGHASINDPDNPFQVKFEDWFLVVKDLAGGEERILNEGLPCFQNAPHESCRPNEGPAYVPSWTPDGSAIGFITIRSINQVCICVVDADGSNPRPLIDSRDLAITWYDWIRPGPAPGTAVEPGSLVSPQRLLFGGTVANGAPFVAAGTQDRWGGVPIPLPAGVVPEDAAWSKDGRYVAVVARVPYDARFQPFPAPPSGESRHEHFTLEMLDLIFEPPVVRPDVPQQQIFLIDLEGGGSRQLTTPWIEDYLDGVHPTDPRGNVDPEFSPDGRHLIFTNVSSATHESFLLRYDLRDGTVVNLTNVTAGAMPVADLTPEYSPDGRRIAFSSTVDGFNDLYVVNADGSAFRQLTRDDFLDLAPTWSPDGRFVVYSSYRGDDFFQLNGDPVADLADAELPLTDWFLVRLDVATGEQTLLTDGSGGPAFRPIWSPDGTTIAYISASLPGQPDIYVIPAEGGRPRPLQVTLRTHESFVDWR